jgi:glutamyl-tRNA synthetase
VADVLSAQPVSEWHPEPLLAAAKAVAESSGAKLGDILQPVRVALTGSTVSEPVNELLAVVGKEESLRRIEQAIAG